MFIIFYPSNFKDKQKNTFFTMYSLSLLLMSCSEKCLSSSVYPNIPGIISLKDV